MKIYHHNDLDGRCAAAIVLRYANLEPIEFQKIETIEIDYKDEIDLSRVKSNEEIVIVDFSFKPETMNALLIITQNVIWLDHHKTAFEYKYDLPDGKFVELNGIRNAKFSGCELAWSHFCYGKPVPEAVTLLGDYDKWALVYQPVCFEFYEGLKMEGTIPQSKLWDRLFNDSDPQTLSRIVEQGKSAIRYRDNYCEKIRHDFGYETELDGHKGYATNFYQFGSKGFGEKMQEYDFCVAYIFDGRWFTVSLYSEKIDVSEICKKHGGGGHSGAAGFTCETLPFKRNQ